MSATSVLSQGQFKGTRQKRRDPTGEGSTTAKISSPESKTMRISAGHLPTPPDKHIHHRKAGRRSHRAR